EVAQRRQRAGAGEEGAAQHAVLDDVAERIGAELVMVVMQEKRRIGVGDADLADRLGLGGDAVPQPDAGEDALRAQGDRRGPPVERLARHARRVLAIDDRDLEPGARAGDAQAESDEPAADDDQLAARRRGGGAFGDFRLRHGARMRRSPRLVQIARYYPNTALSLING